MKYVSREQWDAIVPRENLRPLKPKKVKGMVVHHTTGPAIEPHIMIQSHDKYHRWTRGWSGGLAYNWLVSADGQIFEGRGWNQGGATKGWNHRSVAVCYIGDSNEHFSEDGKKAMLEVFNNVRATYGEKLWIKVHSDFKATDCPGSNLRSWVKHEAPDLLSEVSDARAEKPLVGSEFDALVEFFKALRMAVIASPLKRWSRSNNHFCVLAVQNSLKARKFDAGPVDGKYGRKTKAAVKAFQKTRFLPSNGVVGAATWDELFPA